jgi:ADP-dependent NAD(P)H-hydrate dehydratase / NAD(P)H-hydrate epimerase
MAHKAETVSNGLYRSEELRRIEQQHGRNLPPGTLMARAGGAAAQWLDRRVAVRPASFLMLCGPGNNGGDGYVCARILRELGHSCLCWSQSAPTTDDARGAHAAWLAAGGESTTQLPKSGRFDAIVDAMFGIGLSRPLSGAYLEASNWANDNGIEVIALDVPSGLDADSGAWVGDVPGIRAHATVTFLGDKPGLHMSDGCDGAGIVHVDRLGIEAETAAGQLNGPDQFAAVTARRKLNSHKGRYGTVAVIGGESGMVGAALLAGRSALRLGAGRVYVCCVGAPDLSVDPYCPELMIRSLDRLPAVEVAVIGCGLGTSELARRTLRQALGQDTPVVLDADALNLIASDDRLKQALIGRNAPSVLTPHPAEAARLLAGVPAIHVNADRIAATILLAQQLSATIVLKGAGTVIVERPTDRERYWINPTGGPALSSAGTGDVLSGMIGALMVQGFETLTATLAAVWLHGAAAQAYGGDIGLLASEVPALAVRELARLRRDEPSR